MKINKLRKKNLKKIKTLDFDLILSYAIKKEREFLYSHPEYKLSFFEYLKFKFYLNKISKGLPIAYITKTKEFFGLDFFVNQNVLIPRPETEIMVEEVLKNIKENSILIDVGTGSGCIPISILKNIDEKIKTFAIDISKKALEVAKKNAKKYDVDINFLHGNLLKPIFKNHNLKAKKLIITANLPYVWKEWKNNTSAETIGLKFEPQIALFTGKDGLELYDKFLAQLKILIKTHNLKPVTYLEIDPRQSKKIKTLIKKYLPKADIQIIKDLAELNRVVKINHSN